MPPVAQVPGPDRGPCRPDDRDRHADPGSASVREGMARTGRIEAPGFRQRAGSGGEAERGSQFSPRRASPSFWPRSDAIGLRTLASAFRLQGRVRQARVLAGIQLTDALAIYRKQRSGERPRSLPCGRPAAVRACVQLAPASAGECGRTGSRPSRGRRDTRPSSLPCFPTVRVPRGPPAPALLCAQGEAVAVAASSPASRHKQDTVPADIHGDRRGDGVALPALAPGYY